MSRDIVIPPSGAVPGQAGKVFTILALTESGSFTDDEREALLTRITVSAEATTCQASDADDDGKRRQPKKCNLINAAVIACLWTAYTLCNAAYSIISPFFPQIVSILMFVRAF